MKPLIAIALSFALSACATQFTSKDARLLDTKGHPLSDVQIKIRGDAPKLQPFGIAIGPTYMETTTDQRGRFALQIPRKKPWYLEAERGTTHYRIHFAETKRPPVTLIGTPIPPQPIIRTLDRIQYRLSDSFSSYTLTVYYPITGPYGVLESRGVRKQSAAPERLFRELETTSPFDLSANPTGERRPITDAGVIDITWHYSDGSRTIHRDLAMKRPLEGRVKKIRRLCDEIFAAMTSHTKE